MGTFLRDQVAAIESLISRSYCDCEKGKAIQEQPATTLGPEPWFITKISNSTELAEFRVSLYGREAR